MHHARKKCWIRTGPEFGEDKGQIFIVTKTLYCMYYEYILCHVDDIMSISHRRRTYYGKYKAISKLIKDKIEDPEIYLGSRLAQKVLYGKSMWTMCSTDYVNNAVENIEKQTEK